MPNWTMNKIKCKKSIGDKILEKTEDGYKFDFNKLIPMPDDLWLTAGSVESESIASYYISLTNEEQEILKSKLNNMKIYDDVTYWSKYEKYIDDFIKNPDKLKNVIKNFNGGSEKNDNEITDINVLGKKYVDNIINYGFAQWYDWCCEKWGTKWNVGEDVNVSYDPKTDKYEIQFYTAWSAPYGVIDEYAKICPDEDFNWEYENEDYDGYHTLRKLNGKITHYVTDYEKEEDYESEEDFEM